MVLTTEVLVVNEKIYIRKISYILNVVLIFLLLAKPLSHYPMGPF